MLLQVLRLATKNLTFIVSETVNPARLFYKKVPRNPYQTVKQGKVQKAE